MSSTALIRPDTYVLATGEAAVRRLHALHEIYAPKGRRALERAGLTAGMRVADFGCGVGVVSRMLAEMVGPQGFVTGIDVDGRQVEEAAKLCHEAKLGNTRFVEASAYDTGLDSNSQDFVYCRFLLLHLTDPGRCLAEMKRVLKPGGIIVVEDGDLMSAASIPGGRETHFADLFGNLGPTRGVNYAIANDLYDVVAQAGFEELAVEIHQPEVRDGAGRHLLKWSIEEAGPALVKTGILTPEELAQRLTEMQETIDDRAIVVLPPRMSIVSGRKPQA